MDILRWVTIHPILVHGTIGGIPLMLLAYAVAARKRSGLWLFAGDFILIATAAITIGTAIFGFVAFFVLDWPGGLDLWRWLHLGLGAATGGLLWVMAAFRLRARRRDKLPNYGGLVGASAATLLFATFAGWVGGEVLVYRAGVGVISAQNGALAAPVPQARPEPVSVLDAMGRIRGHFAAVVGEQFEMIVQRPTTEQFQVIQQQASQLENLGRWLAAASEREEETHGHEHSHDHGDHGAEHRDLSMRALATELQKTSRDLGVAAQRQDLAGLAHAIDGVESTCVSCHLEHRWREERELRAER